MDDPQLQLTPRRGFLSALATAGAAIGFGSLVTSRAHAAPRSDGTRNDGGTIPTMDADPALEAWFGRIKGAHRQVFDAPAPNGGMPGVWPRVYLSTMDATYGAAQGSTAVVILRHAGLGLALNDSIWSKYKLGEVFDVKDGDAPATRNIYANITTIPLPDIGIASLLKTGVLVGACDVAMTVYSAGSAQKMGLDPAAVKKEWVAGLLPGVQLVPSGVMAVGRAQEQRCTYCFAG